MILMLGCMNIHVLAADFSAELSYNSETDSYSVSGSVSGTMGNVPMTLEVRTSDGDFYTGRQTYAVRGDDGVTFTFEPITFLPELATETYTFCISSSFFEEKIELKKNVLSLIERYQFLQAINNCIETGGNGLFDLVKTKATSMQLDSLKLENFNSEGVALFNGWQTDCYDIPDSFDVADESACTQVLEAWKVCCALSSEAVAPAAFVSLESETEVTAWFATYFSALGFDAENLQTPYSESEICKYLDTVVKTTSFNNRIINVVDTDSIENLRAIIYEAVLLSAIENGKYNTVNGIISGFPALFPVNSAYTKLTASELGEIYVKMAGKHYATYREAVDAFDDLVQDALENETGSSGGSGGSRAAISGGGRFSNDIYLEEDDLIFTDLNKASWAEKAIVFLAKRNIVQGRGNGCFAPNDSITRAEFVKIVVNALGISGDTETQPFRDVSADAWYCDSVSLAKRAGIVLGDEQQNFNPDMCVTRQDMAVILCRAFSVTATGVNVDFSDEASIGDYAKEAVSTLSSRGIINGMGDGTFAPQSYATRAQASQMIYNLLQ